jgi:hypothetical protein
MAQRQINISQDFDWVAAVVVKDIEILGQVTRGK